jgi:ectoine hydroxylase-related dioxygenase (phytanoyl-CoA dioxygenase family)
MIHDPEAWQQQYNRDGYLVVENVLDAETLAALRKGIEAITSDPETVPTALRQWLDFERNYVAGAPHMNEYNADEVGAALRNIMELPLFDPVFADIILHEPLLRILEALFGSPEFHFHNYKCIIKAPRISSKFRFHRDLPYLLHTTPNLITAMLCLDPMTRDNGATVVLPGSHRVSDDQVSADDMDIPDEDLPSEYERVTVECPAGSAVLFHVNIIHGGPTNRSDIPRRNVIGIWAGPDTLPITPHRYAYEFLAPLSADPVKQKQVRDTFPHL